MELHHKSCIEKCIVTLVASVIIVLTVLASWIFGISIEHYGSITIFFMAFVIMCDCLKNYAEIYIRDEEKRLRVMRLMYTVAIIAVLFGIFIFIWVRK